MQKKRIPTNGWPLAIGPLLIALMAYKQHDHTAREKSCKILQEKDSIWRANTTRSGVNCYIFSTLDYQYDQQGNQVASKVSDHYTFSDGTVQEAGTSSAFQFDKEGFLINYLYNRTDLDQAGKPTPSNFSYVYQYVGGRLIKTTFACPPGMSQTETYIYDASGHMVGYQDTINNSFNLSIKYEYSNGVLSRITYTDKNRSGSPYLEVNSQGLFTKTIDQGDEIRYEYDTEGEILRQEHWINGQPSSATTFVYDHGKDPYLLRTPIYRGFPAFKYLRPTNQFTPHNLVTVTTFSPGPGNGQWLAKDHIQYTYTYNNNGYPLTELELDYDAAGALTGNGSKKSFTYTDCQ